MAQVVVVRPLAEPHLRDELRVDPLHVALAHARHLRRRVERRRLAVNRTQQLEQLADLCIVEARADVADVAQLVAFVDGEHQRAERVRAAAAAARVAGDDELLVVLGLDLQPLPRALALPVRAVDALRDDPLELLLLRDLEERVAVVEVLRVLHRLHPRVEQLAQQRLALVQRIVRM